MQAIIATITNKYLYGWQPLVKAKPLHAQAAGPVHQRMPGVGGVSLRPREVNPRRLEGVPAAEVDLHIVHQPFPARARAAGDAQGPREDAPIFGLDICSLFVIWAVGGVCSPRSWFGGGGLFFFGVINITPPCVRRESTGCGVPSTRVYSVVQFCELHYMTITKERVRFILILSTIWLERI